MKKVGNYWVPDRETIQLDALARGVWQGDHLDAALMHVRQFRTAVDGGAHIGSWTIEMLKRFKRVFAFEPSPETYLCLNKNLPESALHTAIPLRVALGERPGWATMAEDGKYSNGGNTGGRYLSGQPDDMHGDVQVQVLDDFAIEDLDFLKLDVEGYELYALRGAEQTIRRCHPVVMIEVKHRIAARQGLRAEEAGEFLATLGYVPIDKIGSDEVWSFPT